MATGSGSCRRKRRELVSDDLERWPFQNLRLKNPPLHLRFEAQPEASKCFHLKCVVYKCEKFRKLTTFCTRKGKCFRNSKIDLTQSSELKKLTESHSGSEIEKESPVREAKMLLYWVTITTITVLIYIIYTVLHILYILNIEDIFEIFHKNSKL